MKILALDSSGMVASVAVWEDGLILAEYSTNYKKTHSQTLLPMLEDIKEKIELDMKSLDAIAVAAGPGSFTGLRIGSSTAKGIGLALDIPIIPVPTLEGLAYIFYGADKLICPILDAKRAQTYTGIYAFEKTGQVDNAKSYEMTTILEQCALPIEELLQKLNGLNREVIFLGDGCPVFSETIKQQLEVPYCFAPAHMNRQRAAAVADLAAVYYANGKYESADDHAPVYLRLSQAERERKEALEKEKNA